ncbi:MAG: hypothetical protein U0234_04290 [Sandaracinus sp.]
MSRFEGLAALPRMALLLRPFPLLVAGAALLGVTGCSVSIPVLGDDGGIDAASTGDGALADAALVCPGAASCPACNDGEDDDHDGLTDYPSDPGCVDRQDDDEGEPPPPGPCADGADNDGDRRVDYPADPGCADEEDTDETDPPPPACSNGTDDDGDGKIDFPNDPGCESPQDTAETDACPTGAGCPACADGIDDDGDGAIDFPADAECRSAHDDDERCNEIADGFELDFPGALTSTPSGGPLMASRRASAAHSGRFGLYSPISVVYDPSVITGAPGESASVWVTSLSSDQILSLHFAIAGEHSYACMLNLADELVLYEMGTGAPLPLASTPTTRVDGRWYHLEVLFAAGGAATCRLTEDGASAPLATVTHTIGADLTGPVGVRGFEPTGLDDLEVCR